VARRLFQRALAYSIKLCEMSFGSEREGYLINARNIKTYIAKIDEKLNQKPVATMVTGNGGTSQNAAANGTEAVAQVSEDGINYVANGVNVKEFLSNESNDPVTFDDVKGMEKEKELIRSEFFLDEEDRAFNEYLGKKAKTFILLYGVPGTGKTFFAKAISEELKRYSGNDTPFFSVVGSQLSDSKVGATEKNIQAVFEFCKQFEHCVLFIDEFDTIAPDRKQNTGDPTAASRVTVLLQMMDGFSSSKGTLVIAATNCPYNLDGAVLSRANTRIEIPLPDYEVIYSVLYSKIGNKLAPDVDLAMLASRLEARGYSNRDIKNFIGNMVDSLSKERRMSKARGENKSFEQFCFTNAMIENAFEEIVPTTKQSDMERIKEFKEKGE
jgi:SpoVK/Ycf46/Vps4 family AAA+-type ATPase